MTISYKVMFYSDDSCLGLLYFNEHPLFFLNGYCIYKENVGKTILQDPE